MRDHLSWRRISWYDNLSYEPDGYRREHQCMRIYTRRYRKSRGTTGCVADTKGVSERLLKNGYRFVEDAEGMGLIEGAISDPRRAPDASQVMIGIASGSGADWGTAAWREDPHFTGFCPAQLSDKEADGGSSGKAAPDIQARLAKAVSWLEAVNIVCDTLLAKLAGMFSLPVKDIDRSMRLAKYGMDSLVEVELRNRLGHVLQAPLPIYDVMQSLNCKIWRRKWRERVS
ncbi:MAG: hypothetical protein Q9172_003092 [Xanthocarpia lactea]